MMARVWAVRESLRWAGMEPDLTEDLYLEALRTSELSSWDVRSLIERRWRGEKGEVEGCEVVDGETL